VTHIFSLLSNYELKQYGPDADDEVQLRHLDIHDKASQDVLPFLARECDWIDSIISQPPDGQGGVVLIHCQQGISRSAVFVAAYRECRNGKASSHQADALLSNAKVSYIV